MSELELESALELRLKKERLKAQVKPLRQQACIITRSNQLGCSKVSGKYQDYIPKIFHGKVSSQTFQLKK